MKSIVIKPYVGNILISLFIFCACSCEKNKEPEPEPVSPELLLLELEFSGSVYNTMIAGNQVQIDRKLPHGTTQLTVHRIGLTDQAESTLNAGDIIDLSNDPVTFVLSNDLTSEQVTYSLGYEIKDYSSFVEKHGLLQVSGNRIVDKNEEVISLAGNSFFWSNNGWGGERFYTSGAVSWLILDWETTLVRTALGVDEPGGYLEAPTANFNRVVTLVDAAIDQGVYVLIDWHSHHAEDYPDEAVAFFTDMATRYGEYDNVMYEIYNEPLGVSWSGVIKPYAEQVITAIREIDPDNMIIVGTPEWSQRVDQAAADPITISENIAYTLHFYTVYHQQWLRDRASDALGNGIALFVTEWGSLGYTTTDPETDLWMSWCSENQISHCNWAVNDKLEEWSIVRQGANPNGKWPDSDLTAAGVLARQIIRGWNN